MISAFVSPSVSFWVSEVVISIIAAIGGALVLWGLILEEHGEKDTYPNLDDFRLSKRKEKRGRKILMCGVFIEIVVAIVFAARDGWQAKQTADEIARNDPLNRPFISISAHVKFMVSSNTVATNNNFKLASNPTACAILSVGRYDTNNGFIAPFILEADSFERTWYGTKGPEYSLDLHWSPSLQEYARARKVMSVKETGEFINIGVMSVSFLPADTDIEGGSGKITINSSIEYEFIIPKQKMMAPIIECVFTNAITH